MMAERHHKSAVGLFAMILACIGGIIAFNVVVGVFGGFVAELGLAMCVAIVVGVLRRSPPGEEDADA
jgi:hypothetical protein